MSLTILRNFADSLARVDHVRSALRSHGTGREGVARGGGGGRSVDGARRCEWTAGARGTERGAGRDARWSPLVDTRVVSAWCPKICIRDGHADWERDRGRQLSKYPRLLTSKISGSRENSLAASLKGKECLDLNCKIYWSRAGGTPVPSSPMDRPLPPTWIDIW